MKTKAFLACLCLTFVIVLSMITWTPFGSFDSYYEYGTHSSPATKVTSSDMLHSPPTQSSDGLKQDDTVPDANPKGNLESFPTILGDGEQPQSEQAEDYNQYDLSKILPQNYSSPYNIIEPTVHTPKNPPYTIVTAASSNHFCPLNAWMDVLADRLKRAWFQGDRPRVIVYDLGLFEWQRTVVKAFRSAGYIDEFRRFNYEAYPPYFDVKQSAGEYAWKPAIIAEVANEYPGLIFWLDSGSYPASERLSNARETIDKYGGVLVSTSSGTFFQWTHPNMFDFYQDDDPERYSNIENCNAAVVLVNSQRVPQVVYEWARCALARECIAPIGSSRNNHRQDQAVLTYILANFGYFCTKLEKNLGTISHQDYKCDREIREYERTQKPYYTFTPQERKAVLRYKAKLNAARKRHWRAKDLWLPGL